MYLNNRQREILNKFLSLKFSYLDSLVTDSITLHEDNNTLLVNIGYQEDFCQRSQTFDYVVVGDYGFKMLRDDYRIFCFEAVDPDFIHSLFQEFINSMDKFEPYIGLDDVYDFLGSDDVRITAFVEILLKKRYVYNATLHKNSITESTDSLLSNSITIENISQHYGQDFADKVYTYLNLLDNGERGESARKSFSAQ